MHDQTDTASSLPCIKTLLYHRIDITDTDPWGICVSPGNFEEQIQFLRDRFNVISIKELANQVTTGNIVAGSVCITFDDGYADNYLYAKPILEKFNCPATFFVSTAFTGTSTPFWWDELEMILLHLIKLPDCLLLQIAGANHEYKIVENELTAEQLLQHTHWKWYEEPPTGRCMVFLDVWKKLKPLFYDEIQKQMNQIRQWAGTCDNVSKHRLPMNEDQLGKLSGNDLFTVAIHTHTHPDLEGKCKELQVEEISSCKKMLKNKYGIETNYLAYPYGSYDMQTVQAAKDLGLKACFTTRATGINVSTDMLLLGRYQILNQCGNSLEHQLGLK